MAHAKFNTKSPQWWKHLKEYKRVYWKKVRKTIDRCSSCGERYSNCTCNIPNEIGSF